MTLRIWRSEGGEFVIAESAAEAISVCATMGGYESVADYCNDMDETEDDWTPWPNDEPFPYTMELDHPIQSYDLIRKCKADGFEPVLRRAGEPPTGADVEYHVSKTGLIYTKTCRKLPADWIAEYGAGYFASENA